MLLTKFSQLGQKQTCTALTSAGNCRLFSLFWKIVASHGTGVMTDTAVCQLQPVTGNASMRHKLQGSNRIVSE